MLVNPALAYFSQAAIFRNTSTGRHGTAVQPRALSSFYCVICHVHAMLTMLYVRRAEPTSEADDPTLWDLHRSPRRVAFK